MVPTATHGAATATQRDAHCPHQDRNVLRQRCPSRPPRSDGLFGAVCATLSAGVWLSTAPRWTVAVFTLDAKGERTVFDRLECDLHAHRGCRFLRATCTAHVDENNRGGSNGDPCCPEPTNA